MQIMAKPKTIGPAFFTDSGGAPVRSRRTYSSKEGESVSSIWIAPEVLGGSGNRADFPGGAVQALCEHQRTGAA